MREEAKTRERAKRGNEDLGFWRSHGDEQLRALGGPTTTISPLPRSLGLILLRSKMHAQTGQGPKWYKWQFKNVAWCHRFRL
jgi:hypothetical protein